MPGWRMAVREVAVVVGFSSVVLGICLHDWRVAVIGLGATLIAILMDRGD